MIRVLVIAEAQIDRLVVAALALRGLSEALNRRLGSDQVALGEEDKALFITWKSVPALLDSMRIKRPHGHFSGRPGAPDAHASRRALFLAEALERPPDAVILSRDSDDELERCEGLNQGRNSKSWSFSVIVALAHPKIEAWILAGFLPTNEDERRALASLRQELGFHPVETPHLLTARGDRDKKSAKRVLALLCGEDHERRCRCWMETDLRTARTNGAETGLPEFLDEVVSRLGPMLARAD